VAGTLVEGDVAAESCEVMFNEIINGVRPNQLCKPLKHGTSPVVEQEKRACQKAPDLSLSNRAREGAKIPRLLPVIYCSATKSNELPPRAAMSQDSSDSVLSVLRSLAIFTAFAFAFYFLVVWDPVGTLGDVRNYLEYRVRVPVE
jgi:hypothetical protein